MNKIASQLFGLSVVILIGVLLYLTVFSDGLGKAPDITVKTASGESLQLNKPLKPVLVSFWATTCPGCIAEMPHFAEMKQTFGDKFEVVAIAMSYDPAEQVAKFIEKNPYPFSFVRDTDGQMSQAFGEVLLTPTNFLIAPNGNIVYQKIGEVDYGLIKERLRQMTPDL